MQSLCYYLIVSVTACVCVGFKLNKQNGCLCVIRLGNDPEAPIVQIRPRLKSILSKRRQVGKPISDGKNIDIVDDIARIIEEEVDIPFMSVSGAKAASRTKPAAAAAEEGHGGGDSHVRGQIQELVDSRSIARAKRDFVLADCIKEELLQLHGVKVHDKHGVWEHERDRNLRGPLNAQLFANKFYLSKSTASDATGIVSPDIDDLGHGSSIRMTHGDESIHPTTTSAVIMPIDYTDENAKEKHAEIQELIVARTVARRRWDYSVADDLRYRLAKEYGVEVFDKTNEWRTFDGRLFGLQSTDREGEGFSEEAESGRGRRDYRGQGGERGKGSSSRTRDEGGDADRDRSSYRERRR